MDLIDKGILGDLLANCRISYEELARKYDLSANAVKRRIQKLEERGIITSYHIRVSLAMLDAEYLFGLVLADGSQDEVQFVDLIGSNPCVLAAAAYSDGTYVFLAEYTNNTELMELGAFLRRLGGVQAVELHTLATNKGGKIEFTDDMRKILKHLIDDPRMTIADLARNTGYSARRVRRLLNEMIESKVLFFSVGYELAEEGNLPFLARVFWDERIVTHEAVVAWLTTQYPRALWEWYVSVSEPAIFCLFSDRDPRAMTKIIREIRAKEFVERVKVTIPKHHKSFHGPRYRFLHELVKGIS